MLLADYRKERFLSRNYVARLLGISDFVMFKIENGEIPLSETQIEKLSFLYDLPEDIIATAETHLHRNS